MTTWDKARGAGTVLTQTLYYPNLKPQLYPTDPDIINPGQFFLSF